MAQKRTTSKSSGRREKSAGPLDSAHRKIAEEEAKLRAQMEKYQKLIEQAPKMAAERRQMQREQAAARMARIEGRFGNGSSVSLPDRRFELNAGAPARMRRFRAERNRGRFMFFVLLLIFGAAVCFLYWTVKYR
jgi:hypothetical protein